MIPHSALHVLECDGTDEALVERVRRGDNAAFEELYRRHSRVAVSVARKIVGSPQDAEDAVSEAFTNVLSALRRQVGPREKFRPYLLTCVRNSCLQRIRRAKQASRQERRFADDEPLQDERIVEGAVAAAAFQSMPARWQSALWMAEVQHLDPVTIAERLDVNVAAAGALVYRARQGFTEAYLAQHLSHAGRPECAALAPKLAQYVRGTAGLMASRQVKNHIDECPACMSAIEELADVNSSLRSLTPPLALLTTAGTTGAVSGGTATVAVSGFGLGWLANIAAVAVLSTAPVLLGSDASMAATGIGGSTRIELGAHATQTSGPRAGLRDHTVTDSAPTVGTSPPSAKPSTDPTPGGANVDEPPGLSAEVPSRAGGTSVDLNAGDIGTATTLPAPLTVTVTLPTIPGITVPQITVPPTTLPEITVPPTTLPQITVPPTTLPEITVPPTTLP